MRAFFLPLLLFFFSCSSNNVHHLKVAATKTPHGEILQFVKKKLREEGIDLQIINVEDYSAPNRDLVQRKIDANFFQHVPFLDNQIEDYHYCLIPYALTHIEPMGLYSNNFNSIEEIPPNAKVAIPNDPTNQSRALLLLQKAGLIRLNSNDLTHLTAANIVENPRYLVLISLDAQSLAKALKIVDLAAIPTNFVLQTKISPSDALFKENASSPYVNALVIRCGDETRQDLQKLKAALLSPETRQFILEHFHGALIPVF